MAHHLHPTDTEKHSYINHRFWIVSCFSILSFVGIVISSWRYFGTHPLLYVFFPFLGLSIIYYLVSFYVQGFGKGFAHDKHLDLVRNWQPKDHHNVDIFLPTCGEDIGVITNTWEGVRELVATYKGNVRVYNLDDANDPRLKALSEKFGFTHIARNDRSYKKAGNLHNGFMNSTSEFIAIFDADFRPRADFFNELLPRFDLQPTLGIIQTPQYFDVVAGQNWLERGAGAVQELFYRAVQQNRQRHGAAICVGTNAIYRRAALNANSGPTLIEHSEDVHTGFDVCRHGWTIEYVPLVLAKGTCPNSLTSFFRQQYRWCKGSMSLLSDKKFWQTRLGISARLCYVSGFFYYINTAVFSIVGPLIPLSLVTFFPEQAKIVNYTLLIPAYLYVLVILPWWHQVKYRHEVYSVKFVYAWAHLFAIIDSIFGTTMDWHPTGSTHPHTWHYRAFQICVFVFALPVAIIWTAGALWYTLNWNVWDFMPLILSGVAYAVIVLRVVHMMILKRLTHTVVALIATFGIFLVATGAVAMFWPNFGVTQQPVIATIDSVESVQ